VSPRRGLKRIDQGIRVQREPCGAWQPPPRAEEGASGDPADLWPATRATPCRTAVPHRGLKPAAPLYEARLRRAVKEHVGERATASVTLPNGSFSDVVTHSRWSRSALRRRASQSGQRAEEGASGDPADLWLATRATPCRTAVPHRGLKPAAPLYEARLRRAVKDHLGEQATASVILPNGSFSDAVTHSRWSPFSPPKEGFAKRSSGLQPAAVGPSTDRAHRRPGSPGLSSEMPPARGLARIGLTFGLDLLVHPLKCAARQGWLTTTPGRAPPDAASGTSPLASSPSVLVGSA
jgi:hypothetical protein